MKNEYLKYSSPNQEYLKKIPMEIEEVKERNKFICIQYGDGETEFNTRDISFLINQLEIEERQNEIFIETIEDIKNDVLIYEEKSNRLQSRVIELEGYMDKLRDEITAKTFREMRLEDLLALHQELTQWIEEVYDNDFKFLDNSDFVEQLIDKVIKLNK